MNRKSLRLVLFWVLLLLSGAFSPLLAQQQEPLTSPSNFFTGQQNFTLFNGETSGNPFVIFNQDGAQLKVTVTGSNQNAVDNYLNSAQATFGIVPITSGQTWEVVGTQNQPRSSRTTKTNPDVLIELDLLTSGTLPRQLYAVYFYIDPVIELNEEHQYRTTEARSMVVGADAPDDIRLTASHQSPDGDFTEFTIDLPSTNGIDSIELPPAPEGEFAQYDATVIGMTEPSVSYDMTGGFYDEPVCEADDVECIEEMLTSDLLPQESENCELENFENDQSNTWAWETVSTANYEYGFAESTYRLVIHEFDETNQSQNATVWGEIQGESFGDTSITAWIRNPWLNDESINARTGIRLRIQDDRHLVLRINTDGEYNFAFWDGGYDNEQWVYLSEIAIAQGAINKLHIVSIGDEHRIEINEVYIATVRRADMLDVGHVAFYGSVERIDSALPTSFYLEDIEICVL